VIPANPARGVKVPSARLADRKMRVLDAGELAALVAAAPEGVARCLLRLLGEGGLRISEALGLTWADLDLSADPPRLRVERRIVRGEVGPPKSGYGRRRINLGRQLAAELRAWRMASPYSQEGDPVFAGPLGTPPEPWALRRQVLDPAAEAAGLDVPGFHVLRHTCATNLLRRGVAPLVVSRWMGHHSPAFTLSVYGHVAPADLPDLDALAELSEGRRS
jgi:integrase